MNIPEVTNEMKQGVRSESVVPAQATAKAVAQDDAHVGFDAVQKPDGAKDDKQSTNLSKDTLNSLIAEAEEHLEANDVKLKFNVLEEADTVQVEIVDGDGKTIRKIPEDDLLKLSKSLKNLGKGFLDEVS